MEVEVSIASQTGHWKVAEEVATFLARGVATCVETLIDLYIVCFTVGTAACIEQRQRHEMESTHCSITFE